MTQNSNNAVLALVASGSIASFAAANAADYQFAFQEAYGGPATFFLTGSAVAPTSDGQGDAFLVSVVYADGSTFMQYNPIVNIHDVTYNCAGGQWNLYRARAGTNCTVGYNFGLIELPGIDGNAGNVTNNDKVGMADLILGLLRSPNLNNYFGSDNNASMFEFTIEFKYVVKDNDPGPDEIGEILYFERGPGAGNSWLKMQAVDEDGNALGPWLLTSPDETLQTTPVASILNGQSLGTIAIDVSRLGVSEFQYLRVSSDCTGDPAYTGGGDSNPDFSIMTVVTNPTQLTELGLICD